MLSTIWNQLNMSYPQKKTDFWSNRSDCSFTWTAGLKVQRPWNSRYFDQALRSGTSVDPVKNHQGVCRFHGAGPHKKMAHGQKKPSCFCHSPINSRSLSQGLHPGATWTKLKLWIVTHLKFNMHPCPEVDFAAECGPLKKRSHLESRWKSSHVSVS
jgi:hypothetical protein